MAEKSQENTQFIETRLSNELLQVYRKLTTEIKVGKIRTNCKLGCIRFLDIVERSTNCKVTRN